MKSMKAPKMAKMMSKSAGASSKIGKGAKTFAKSMASPAK